VARDPGQFIEPELDAIDPAGTTNVIVQYTELPTQNHHGRVHQLGGKLQNDLGAIKAAHYSVPASALERLAVDPDSDSAQAGYNNGSGIGVAFIDSGIHAGGTQSVHRHEHVRFFSHVGRSPRAALVSRFATRRPVS
jgi:hypothetical protein